MANNNNAKITLSVGTIAIAALASLIIATIAITPQQMRALSTYDNTAGDVAKGKTDQKLQQDDLGNTAKPTPTTPTLPAVSTTNCAMDTIESLESFLSCLGAK